ncbi:AMP-dependent synthetase/ligase [Verrucomicrobiota bacterium]
MSATTIKTLLLDACRLSAESVALRYKQGGTWRAVSYGRLLANVKRAAELMGALQVRRGERVGLLLENGPLWPEIYFAIACTGSTAVPVDTKLAGQEISHVLRDSGCKALFASAGLHPLLREIEGQSPELARAVLVGAEGEIPKSPGRLRYLSYEEAVEGADASGRGGLFDTRHPGEDDLASIIYTSGTTGPQKGAMLTHANFCSNVASCLAAIGVHRTDNFLLVLPLHHSFAFTTNLLVPISAGAEISFVESLKTVGDNAREVSPTVLIGVPLLVEKLYARLRDGLRSKPVGRALLGLGIRGPVIRRVREGLGGRLRVIAVGGAPCPTEVLLGLERLGLPILEGYGLTETGPVLTFNPPDRPKPGTAGKPIAGVELRIVEPDDSGVGEVAAKGTNVMRGYWNDPDATAAVFDNEWFLTGDLGRLDSEGYLALTGRKKSIIVNREGKNIHPEEVENAVCSSPVIREALVLGFRLPGEAGERVGALVVPDREVLDERASAQGRPLTAEEIEAMVRGEVKRTASAIADYKRPRRVQVRSEEFEKTSTGKIKRYLYAMNPEEP